MIILGAGLAGCIAGHMFPGSLLMERGSKESVGAHKALLRFRSDAISRITGIPFRKVLVHKSLAYSGQEWSGGRVPLWLQNMYSRKVTGALSSRSIWDLQPVERFVAPDDFHAQMVDHLEINWEWEVTEVSKLAIGSTKHSKSAGPGVHRGWEREPGDAVISTLPLPVVLKLSGAHKDVFANPGQFKRSPIHVQRWKIKNCDLYQTIYFPDPNHPIYRASITGDTLIVEAMGNEEQNLMALLEKVVLPAFDLKWADTETVGNVSRQEYGKIVPLEDDARHEMLMELTQKVGVYSLGRFATWRNILLDDLPGDADRIRELMSMSEYRRKLTRS